FLNPPSTTKIYTLSLHDALPILREAIDELVATSRDLGIGEHYDVLESYRMFAADRGWVRRIADAIRSGLTAEAAVQKVREDTRRSEEHTSELQSRGHLVCRLLLE